MTPRHDGAAAASPEPAAVPPAPTAVSPEPAAVPPMQAAVPPVRATRHLPTARRAAWELAAVVASLGIRMWSKRAEAMPIGYALIIGGWATYLAFRVVRRPALLREWGFGWRATRQSLARNAAATGILAAAVLALALVVPGPGTPRIGPLSILLYAAWVVAQQFALQVVFADSIRAFGLRGWPLLALAGTVFGLAHLPLWELALLAGPGAAVWVHLGQRDRNLWLLSAGHFIVGALAQLLILDRNPVGEFVSQMPAAWQALA